MLVAENIYQLNGMPGMGVWGANVFLLVDKDLTLIDTGFKGRAGGILAQIKKLGYSISDVTRIIVTHHHIDHVGSLAELKSTTGAKVVAHEADSPYIDGTLLQPGPVKHNTLSKALTPLYRLWAHTPVAVDIMVDDGDELPVLGGIKVVHTPGHTHGSISLLLKKEKLAIVGDLMSRGKRIRLPAKAFTVDPQQEIRSIARLAGLEFNVICFGHGMPILSKARYAVAAFAETLMK